MAGVFGFAAPAAITLTASTGPFTALQVVAAANHRTLVEDINIAMNGGTATDPPVLWEVLRQSTAGTMSALTPVKENAGDDEALQTTAQHTATAEPTAGDVLWRDYIHPMTGVRVPLSKIPIVGGGRLGVRWTATTLTGTVKAAVSARFQE